MSVIPFPGRASGTTAGDLEAVRRVLRAEAGWVADLVPQTGAPWIAATGPAGISWAIGCQDGAWFAAPDDGERPGWAGLRSAAAAARIVRDAR